MLWIADLGRLGSEFSGDELLVEDVALRLDWCAVEGLNDGQWQVRIQFEELDGVLVAFDELWVLV